MVRADPGRPNFWDQGVTFQPSGTPLTRVRRRPVSGQYSFKQHTGEYLFSHLDSGKSVQTSVAAWDGQVYTQGVVTRTIP